MVHNAKGEADAQRAHIQTLEEEVLFLRGQVETLTKQLGAALEQLRVLAKMQDLVPR
ncbi:MAG: hypothetical protein ABMA02_18990 [Saprospiraceae bacterium]